MEQTCDIRFLTKGGIQAPRTDFAAELLVGGILVALRLLRGAEHLFEVAFLCLRQDHKQVQSLAPRRLIARALWAASGSRLGAL